MAAIGSIRKHGVALMIIIGLALLAFIVGDLSQVTRTFSNKNVMAKIDGKNVDKEYSAQYEQNTALMRLIQNKSSFDENETYQIHEMTWRQILQEKVLEKQLKALGMVYTDQMVEDFKADMIASLNSKNPNQYLMQFAQALAQQYGPENAMAIISNIEEYANNEQARELYNAYQALVRIALSAEKASHYFALANGSIYFPTPLAKKLASDNNMAMVSLMAINPQAAAFNNIEVKVDSKEVKDFYKTHKDDLFTVVEKNRDIDVAVFPINPTTTDLKNIEDSVRGDYAKFVASESLLAYSTAMGNGFVDSTYYKEEDINLDTLKNMIFNYPVGSNIEPFVYENTKWYFGKVYGGAARPDSIQVATIELPFKSANNPNAKFSKKEARLLADSLKGVIASNQASIFALQANYRTGQATDTTIWLPERGTIPEIYNNLNDLANGGVYVYKASAGYIVFQVLTKTAPIQKRQFVLYDYDILASDATVNSIKSQANAFAQSVNSAEQLMSAAAKKGIQTVKGQGILSMASNIGQLPNCRDIVSWAFSEDVEKDAISDVFNVERMFFAVAAVSNVRETGVEKFKDVKSDIENQLKAEKKAQLVAEQINSSLSSSNMAAVAQQYSTQVMDSIYLSFTGDAYQNRNIEGKVIGQIFALPTNKPTAVYGKNMVFVVNVNNVQNTPATPNYALERNILHNEMFGRERNENILVNYFVSKANVIDNRCRFYQK